MKNTGSLTAIIALSLAIMIIVLSASLKHQPIVVENQAVAEITESAAERDNANPDRSPEVGAIVFDNGKLVIGAENGIYLIPSIGASYNMYKTNLEMPIQFLNVILPKGDYRYVGGNGLYMLDSSYQYIIDEVELPNYENYKGQVFSLMDFGNGVLIGTDNGLWYHCDDPADDLAFIDTLVLPGVIVTAMAQDMDALWIGTYGDGLFRYDGSSWSQRYLKRDTLAFCVVNALEYQYPFLWVGTDMGLYRFNGGQWNQMFANDSTETFEVTSIMSTAAATYIGTSDGLMRCASDTLRWIDNFNGLNIAGFCRNDKGVVVATRFDGIYTFNGKEELVSPEQLRLCKPGIIEDKDMSVNKPLWLTKGSAYVWEPID